MKNAPKPATPAPPSMATTTSAAPTTAVAFPPRGPTLGETNSLESRNASLKAELAHKDYLLEQGFEKFIETAEKLREGQRILERRVAELNQEVEERKNYLSNIFESLSVGVLVTDLDGQVTSVNRTAKHLLGRAEDSMAEQHINQVLGEQLLSESSTQHPESAPAAAPDDPITFIREDGEERRLQLTANLMLSEQNAPQGFIFNVQDVTLFKRLEEQAERRNRFTAMGEMAANIAHEIRNPLGSIELFTSLVQKNLDPDAEPATLINHISSNVASMNHIIGNLLAYTKPRPVSPLRVDLHALITQAAEMWHFMAEQHGVTLETELAAPQAPLCADAEQLKQVLNNLVMNALQAMPEGGRLQVRSRRLYIEDPLALARFSPDEPEAITAGEFLEVQIRDTGVGISKDILRKIFDPFFSTKARGTGLGLAIVHHILAAHHATIDVDSQIERGTKVVMMFSLLKD